MYSWHHALGSQASRQKTATAGTTTMNRYVAGEKEQKQSRVVHTLWRDQNWRSEGREEQTDMGGLCCLLRPCWCPSPICDWRPCLGPWSYHNWDLWLCLWPVLLAKVMRMPGICSITWGHAGVQGPYCHQSHTNLSGLCCYPGSCRHLGLGCGWGPCLDLWPCFRQCLWWCP